MIDVEQTTKLDKVAPHNQTSPYMELLFKPTEYHPRGSYN